MFFVASFFFCTRQFRIFGVIGSLFRTSKSSGEKEEKINRSVTACQWLIEHVCKQSRFISKKRRGHFDFCAVIVQKIKRFLVITYFQYRISFRHQEGLVQAYRPSATNAACNINSNVHIMVGLGSGPVCTASRTGSIFVLAEGGARIASTLTVYLRTRYNIAETHQKVRRRAQRALSTARWRNPLRLLIACALWIPTKIALRAGAIPVRDYDAPVGFPFRPPPAWRVVILILRGTPCSCTKRLQADCSSKIVLLTLWYFPRGAPANILHDFVHIRIHAEKSISRLRCSLLTFVNISQMPPVYFILRVSSTFRTPKC